MKLLLHTLSLIFLLASTSFSLSGQKTFLPKQLTLPSGRVEWCYEVLSEIEKPEVVVSNDNFKSFIDTSLHYANLHSYSEDVLRYMHPGLLIGQNSQYAGKYLFSTNTNRAQIDKLLTGFCFFPIYSHIGNDTVKTIGWRVVIAYQEVDRLTVSDQVSLLEFDDISELVDQSFVEEITNKNELNLLFRNTARLGDFTTEQQDLLRNSVEFDFVFLPYNDYIDLIQSGSEIVIERSRITYDTTVACDLIRINEIPITEFLQASNLPTPEQISWHFRSLAFRPAPTPFLWVQNGQNFGTAAYAYVDGRRCPPYWWDDDFNLGVTSSTCPTSTASTASAASSTSAASAASTISAANATSTTSAASAINAASTTSAASAISARSSEVKSSLPIAKSPISLPTPQKSFNITDQTQPESPTNTVDSVDNKEIIIRSTLNQYGKAANSDASGVAKSYNKEQSFGLSKVSIAIGAARPTGDVIGERKTNLFLELGVQAHFRLTDIYLTLGRYNLPNEKVVNSINISPIRPVIFSRPAFSAYVIGDLAFNWQDRDNFSLGYRAGILTEISFPRNQPQNPPSSQLKAIFGIQYQDFAFNNNFLPNMIGLKAGLSYSFSSSR